MTTSTLRWPSLALGVASLVFGTAVSGFQNPSRSNKVTPGSIALLMNDLDDAGLKQIGAALDHQDALVRTVAARSLATLGRAPLADAVARALEREQNEVAAIELARALLFMRGSAAFEVIDKRTSTFRGLASLSAEFYNRIQPERLGDGLPKWAAALGDNRLQLNQHVRAALDKAPTSAESLLRAWLEASDARAWGLFLSTLPCEGSPAQTVVLADGVKSKDADKREQTVWMFVVCLVRNQTVPAALLDVAMPGTPETGSPIDNASWEQLGRELIARRRNGTQTPDRSALITAEAAKHILQARGIGPMPELLPSERRALRAIVMDENLKAPPPGRTLPEDKATASVPAMRTFPKFWPGFLESVFSAARCKPNDKSPAGVVLVAYEVGGRVNRISVGPDKLPGGCGAALSALARLTLADAESPTEPGVSEYLILPLDEEYVQCVTEGEPADDSPPGRIGGKIQPPQKVRDVRPVYPEGAQRSRIQGMVMLETTISRTGCVHSLRVIRSAHPALNFAGLRAVPQWRFTPTLLDGRPVPVLMTVTVSFSLQ
jgi:TonB family protein